ncbi:MAG: response regulator transcription factor [Actinobacteria bacterium]|nr:response regulator transcription factor [Actinomycetota bacterium]
MRELNRAGSANIVVLDEDVLQLELTGLILERDGHRPITTAEPRSALRALEDEAVDLLILETTYACQDGYRLGEQIRQARPLLGIIVTSGRDHEDEVIRSLLAFADDFVAKPFSPRELQARVHAVLRRSQMARGPRAAEADLVAGDIVLDRYRMRATVEGVVVPLTPREISLLAVLMTNPDHVLSRDQLIRLAWGHEFEGGPKAVDVYVQRLRKKVGLLLTGDSPIEAVRGLGYRLSTRRRQPPRLVRAPEGEPALAV